MYRYTEKWKMFYYSDLGCIDNMKDQDYTKSPRWILAYDVLSGKWKKNGETYE